MRFTVGRTWIFVANAYMQAAGYKRGSVGLFLR